MIRFINTVLLTAVLFFSSVQAQEWVLLWSDEFNERRLDTANWTIETGSDWGNNELEYCTDGDNILFNDSCLIIELREERVQNKDYTSARIITKGKFSSLYGRIEVRLKAPYSKGLWPAVWTLGANYDETGWPDCGEIDIFEMACGDNFDDQRGDNAAFAVVHYSDLADRPAGERKAVTIDSRMSDEFHVFSCEWNEEYLHFYFDSSQTPFFSFDITKSYLNEFHFPHFIIMNLSMGGPFAGMPDNTTILPQRLTIDWIRWYKKNTSIHDKFKPEKKTSDFFIDKVDSKGICFSGNLPISFALTFYSFNGKTHSVINTPGKIISGKKPTLLWKNIDAASGLYVLEIIDKTSNVFYREKIFVPFN